MTLVILSAVPFLILIQGLSQASATPRIVQENTLIARAASLVSRVASNIGAVKAANAASYEHNLLTRIPPAIQSLGAVWGVTAGTTQFVSMAMFVQGFWFGAHLVLQGKNKPGDVMSVFWACLIATSNLQMTVPLLVVLAKGKAAAAELSAVISASQRDPMVFLRKHHKMRPLRRIMPDRFAGDFSFVNFTFSYPTRPTVPILCGVEMFFPPGETTFVVGPSGCGKSTIGSILLGYYSPALGKGEVLLDGQDLRYLDATWVRRHVAGVTQGSAGASAQVFRGSIHWNVALGAVGSGRRAEDVTRAEVEEACRLAMLESWVSGLEAGYDTTLAGSGENGNPEGGVVLSGGMRQRLALARARIRDPDVLILGWFSSGLCCTMAHSRYIDESTSALDPPTRLLTTAAIRTWRTRGTKTTIIITHDLTSINSEDFVYVMRNGRVAEQGFRYELEKAGGEWQRMMQEYGCSINDRFSDDHLPVYEEVAEILASQDEEVRHAKHYSLAPTLSGVRPVTMAIGGWMYDVVSELTRPTNGNAQDEVPPLPTTPITALNHATEFEGGASGRIRRPSSTSILIPSPTVPPRVYDGRRTSLQFNPTRSSFTNPFASTAPPQPMVTDDEEFDGEKMNLKRSGEEAAGRRKKQERRAPNAIQVVSTSEDTQSNATAVSESHSAPGLIATLRLIYPTIPAKRLLFIGLVTCLLSGAMTPIFSFLLSTLMFQISANPGSASINSYGAFVFGMAAIDGLFMGLRFSLMDTSAILWVTRLRNTAFSRILMQDKAWFDSPAHSPAVLAQALVKDVDDARTLVAVVMGQSLVVVAMMGLGLVWAMVWGWQLTLVGLAIGPVFVGVMALQAGLTAKCEVRNKRAREEVARVYYEVRVRSVLDVPAVHPFWIDDPQYPQHPCHVPGACSSIPIRQSCFCLSS